MADRFLWIPVLGTLQAVEYGAERPVPSSLVLLEGLRLAGQLGEVSCKPRAAPRSEYAPAQEAVGAPQAQTFPASLQQLLQRRVQRIRLGQGESQLDGGIVGQPNEPSPGRCDPGL